MMPHTRDAGLQDTTDARVCHSGHWLPGVRREDVQTRIRQSVGKRRRSACARARARFSRCAPASRSRWWPHCLRPAGASVVNPLELVNYAGIFDRDYDASVNALAVLSDNAGGSPLPTSDDTVEMPLREAPGYASVEQQDGATTTAVTPAHRIPYRSSRSGAGGTRHAQ